MPAADQYKIWANELQPDAVRLVGFQRWLACELTDRLVWPADQDKTRRQVGQVSAFIERAVADLGRHGFLFRASELAYYITGQLDHIAAYQRKGKVGDLYAYLRSTWSGWVSRQAENLAKAAREQGVHRNQVPDRRAPSMPEIVLKNLQSKKQEIDDKRLFRAQVARARKPRCSDAAIGFLPGFSSPTNRP